MTAIVTDSGSSAPTSQTGTPPRARKVHNTKAKGTRNEHRSIKYYEARGYACCRAAASLGLWDVIAAGPAGVVFIQVKTNRPPARAEMQRMEEAVYPDSPYFRKELHIWYDGKREPKISTVATTVRVDVEAA